jgi:hypothetical protein
MIKILIKEEEVSLVIPKDDIKLVEKILPKKLFGKDANIYMDTKGKIFAYQVLIPLEQFNKLYETLGEASFEEELPKRGRPKKQ